MYFSDNEFEVGVNNSIFSGNEQQKVWMTYDCLSRVTGSSNDVSKSQFLLWIRSLTYDSGELFG